jgi:hypothetical protein
MWMIPRWSWKGAAVASLLTDGSLAVFSWVVLFRIRRASVQRFDAHVSEARQATPTLG